MPSGLMNNSGNVQQGRLVSMATADTRLYHVAMFHVCIRKISVRNLFVSLFETITDCWILNMNQDFQVNGLHHNLNRKYTNLIYNS